LSRRFLAGLRDVSGARLYGISDPARIPERTPTFGFTLDRCIPHTAAERLAERGIFVWDGHFYAKGVVDQLGLAQHGGLIRIGFAHYNTIDEVDQVLTAIKNLAI
jgi:selenocysteine lyase/cysteine desulfurase